MKESIYTTTVRGYPFFFQHGLGSDRVQPQGLLSGLEGIQLISMDSRGHGSSPFTGIDDISFDRYADDVIDLATHLNINQAYVGGISMGAGIALNIALRYPHFAKALVLVRPAWLDQEFPENLKLMAGMADFMKKNEPESFQRTPEFLAWQRKEPLTTASLLAHTKSNLPDYAAELIHKMWSDRPMKHLTDLQKVQVPALVLVSHRDFLHPYAYGITLMRSLPQAHLVEIPSRYEDNGGYERAVRLEVKRFLEKIV